MENIRFDRIYQYDTLQTGITVLVVLQYDGKEADFEAKIDTGSTHCIFERKHAERLGIDVEKGDEISISTALSSFSAYGHGLTFNVLDIEFVSTVYFAADESFTRNILGRQGFLDRVKLGLIDYEGKLLLSDYK